MRSRPDQDGIHRIRGRLLNLQCIQSQLQRRPGRAAEDRRRSEEGSREFRLQPHFLDQRSVNTRSVFDSLEGLRIRVPEPRNFAQCKGEQQFEFARVGTNRPWQIHVLAVAERSGIRFVNPHQALGRPEAKCGDALDGARDCRGRNGCAAHSSCDRSCTAPASSGSGSTSRSRLSSSSCAVGFGCNKAASDDGGVFASGRRAFSSRRRPLRGGRHPYVLLLLRS